MRWSEVGNQRLAAHSQNGIGFQDCALLVYAAQEAHDQTGYDPVKGPIGIRQSGDVTKLQGDVHLQRFQKGNNAGDLLQVLLPF